jgi:hypothetical protein
MTDMSIAELKDQIKKYEQLLEAEKVKSAKQRERIAQMSAEVCDSNPYSRLMALKRMGIVSNYEVLFLLLFLTKSFTYLNTDLAFAFV